MSEQTEPNIVESGSGENTGDENNTGEKSNYGELYKTDKDFAKWYDRRVTQAVQTAVSNAIQKWEKVNDPKLPEEERLREMTVDQRAAYFENKYKETEKSRERDKEIGALKTATLTALAENNIPDKFIEMFQFDNLTQEEIELKVQELAEYEYFPKGTFQKTVENAVLEQFNARFRQKQPETHGNGVSAPKNPFEEKAKSYEKKKRKS